MPLNAMEDRQIHERVATLETRSAYTDQLLIDRGVIMAAHSRRIATSEETLRHLLHTQGWILQRLTSIEEGHRVTAEELRDEKMRKKERRALLQWILSGLMASAILVGGLSQGQGWSEILSGFWQLPS